MSSVRCKFKTGATGLAIQSVFHRKFLSGWSKEPFFPTGGAGDTGFNLSQLIFKMPCIVEGPSSAPSTAQTKICLLITSARLVIPTPFLHIN